MDSLNGSSLWDYPLPPSLPALADEDFITLLQKQFGANNGFVDVENDKLDNTAQPPQTANINPQSLTRLPIPKPVESPPSDDSSPSPNEGSPSKSRRESGVFDMGSSSRQSEELGDDDPTLKRKASGEDLEDEPNYKTQHTSRKNSHARRKSTGNPGVDESRLLKRKEQNRAAQRAFRERKEKHVKDLEDKVAALEEKNATTQQENETLREVVSRLQSENLRLRQSSFTFSVPPTASSSKQPESSGTTPSSGQHGSQLNMFNTPPSSTTSTTASSHDSPESLFAKDNGDSQLPFLGQNLISLNHSGQQPTATSDAMNLDFGFGPSVPQMPYTTIASNPLFMSFREPDVFDLTAQNQHHNGSQPGQQYDLTQQLFPGWPDVAMNGSDNQSMQAFDLTNSLDELFGTTYGANGNGAGLDFLMNVPKAGSSSSLSPVSHQNANGSTPGASTSPSSAGTSSSSKSSPQSGMLSGEGCDLRKCTKANLAEAVTRDTGSMFVTREPAANSENSTPSPPACEDDACNEFPPCKGLQLPKTQKSDKNIELMSAWKKIRHDPKFQDVDINSLCSEFAAKARCDGCHVVIEPDGMKAIMDVVSEQKKAKQQSQLFSASNAAGLLSK